MENKIKSVGEEFIEYGEKEWAMRHHHTQAVLKEMADKINEIIERRIMEIHLGK